MKEGRKPEYPEKTLGDELQKTPWCAIWEAGERRDVFVCMYMYVCLCVCLSVCEFVCMCIWDSLSLCICVWFLC